MDWKEHFYYDETSPTCLRWVREVRRGKGYKILFKSPGDVAGSFGEGYSGINLDGKVYRTHRVIWELHFGSAEGYDIDHIDGNIHNNAIANLRKVPTVIGTRNCKMRRDNKSGTVGVNRTVKGGTHPYWRVVWYSVDCQRNEKYFSVTKLGEDEARGMAVAYAALKKEILNLEGAGYTERHGKEVG